MKKIPNLFSILIWSSPIGSPNFINFGLDTKQSFVACDYTISGKVEKRLSSLCPWHATEDPDVIMGYTLPKVTGIAKKKPYPKPHSYRGVPDARICTFHLG